VCVCLKYLVIIHNSFGIQMELAEKYRADLESLDTFDPSSVAGDSTVGHSKGSKRKSRKEKDEDKETKEKQQEEKDSKNKKQKVIQIIIISKVFLFHYCMFHRVLENSFTNVLINISFNKIENNYIFVTKYLPQKENVKGSAASRAGSASAGQGEGESSIHRRTSPRRGHVSHPTKEEETAKLTSSKKKEKQKQPTKEEDTTRRCSSRYVEKGEASKKNEKSSKVIINYLEIFLMFYRCN